MQTFLNARRPLYRCSVKSFIYVSLLAVVILLLAAKGIRNEGTGSLHPDTPRYLVNGVFFYDLIRDFPLSAPIKYAQQYYARYPALSLGHHPLLLGLAETPTYAVFGISVCSARLTIVFFMLLGGVMWFLLIRAIYDETVAFFSSLLLITTPFIVEFSQAVMSEIPAVALIIVTTYFFYRYCQFGKSKYAYAFAISLVLSVYARQQAVFMIPVFLCYFLIAKGPRKLITKEIIVSCIIIALLLLPVVPMTLKFSQTNVRAVSEKSLSSRFELSNVLYHVKALWHPQLTVPALILSLLGVGLSLYRRDKRATIFLLWIAGNYLQATYAKAQDPRYSIYWLPVFCLFAAATIDLFRYRPLKVLLSTLVIATAMYQFVSTFRVEPTFAEGYEEAARYVIENRKGESVLYGNSVDSGRFIFFVRKHDPQRGLIVLRADKMLADPPASWVVGERGTGRELIYGILRDLGTGYVVIEDKEFGSPTLDLLREELKSERFVLRKRIPIRSNSSKLLDIASTTYRSKLQGLALAIYEYKEYAPPQPGKVLHMDIRLMGDSIVVPLDDLLRNGYRTTPPKQ